MNRNDQLVNATMTEMFVNKDVEQKLFEKTQHPLVLYETGKIYQFGSFELNGKCQYEKALSYDEAAAEMNHVLSMNAIADFYLSEADSLLKKAQVWLRKAGLEHHDAFGKYELGVTLMISALLSGPRNESDDYYQGLRYIEEAIEDGYCKAYTTFQMIKKNLGFAELGKTLKD